MKSQVIKTLKAALIQIEASQKDVETLQRSNDVAALAVAANNILRSNPALGEDGILNLQDMLRDYNRAMRIHDDIIRKARFVGRAMGPKDIA